MKTLCVAKKTTIALCCMLFYFSCIGHENCYRSLKCSIEYVHKDKINVRVAKCLEGLHCGDYETLELASEGKYYKKWWLDMPQTKCNNGCGNTTLPDSVLVRIILLDDTNEIVLKDTTFSCSQYHLDGDDIELPPITVE